MNNISIFSPTLFRRTRKLTSSSLFIILFLTTLTLRLVYFILLDWLDIDVTGGKAFSFAQLSSFELFLFSVILAPVYETIIYFHWPIKVLRFFKIKNIWCKLLIPALAFSLAHNHSIYLIVGVIPGGIAMTYIYLYLSSIRKNAFWAVVLFHSLNNLIGFCLHYIP